RPLACYLASSCRYSLTASAHLETYTLSLHDALPISGRWAPRSIGSWSAPADRTLLSTGGRESHAVQCLRRFGHRPVRASVRAGVESGGEPGEVAGFVHLGAGVRDLLGAAGFE